MAKTEQKISKFYNVAANRDFSRDFLFRVTAINLAGIENKMKDDELVYAKAASLPGRKITNVPVPYMGLNLNIPGNATYSGAEGYSLTFFLDANSGLRKLFETASRSLFDDATSIGQYGTPDDTYFVELAQLDKNLDILNKYKLQGASIRDIGDVSYNISGGTGQTVELPVTIAYHFYTITEQV
jgi:hypothetical protein